MATDGTRMWDTSDWGWSGLGGDPTNVALTGMWWKRDRMRDLRAAGREGGSVSFFQPGLSCRDPKGLGQLLLPGGTVATGSHLVELQERLGVPGEGESSEVAVQPESRFPGAR